MLGADDLWVFGAAGTVTDGKVKFRAERTSRDVTGTVFAGINNRRALLTGYLSGGFGKTDVEKGGVKVNTLTAGLQGAVHLWAGPVKVTPHAGIRMYRIDADGAEKATVFEVPFGVRLKGRFTLGRQAFMPVLDVTHVRIQGDRSVTVETNEALVESAFAGRHRTEAKLGLSTWLGRWRTELVYDGAAGEGGYRSNAFSVKGTYRF